MNKHSPQHRTRAKNYEGIIGLYSLEGNDNTAHLFETSGRERIMNTKASRGIFVEFA